MVVYIKESELSGAERSSEHYKDFWGDSKKSNTADHIREAHMDLENQASDQVFKITVVENHTSEL